MELSQIATQKQTLLLSAAMRQTLHCLELPILELYPYIAEAVVSNPLLELDFTLPEPRAESVSTKIHTREWTSSGNPELERNIDATATHTQTYSEYLEEQIGQMKELDARASALCGYLIGCLNSAGYLDCSLSELAEETGCSRFELEQALYIVQSLDPIGTGARNLQECLVLQLVQSTNFNELNLRMIRSGLELLSDSNYAALAKLFGVPVAKIKESAAVIRAMNPIPSRGFPSEQKTCYIYPEAEFRVEHDHVVVQMGASAVPRLDKSYLAMIGDPAYVAAQAYLRSNHAKAKELIAAVEKRGKTLGSILSLIAVQQADFFLHGAPLVPMTMQQVAEWLGLNASTISRAVKDKYIECNGALLPLRSFFTTPIHPTGDKTFSSELVRRKICELIRNEPKQHPFSDEALRQELNQVGISISRRTVAKYRAGLHIPTAEKRRKA